MLLFLAIISIFGGHVIRLILARAGEETQGKGVPTSVFTIVLLQVLPSIFLWLLDLLLLTINAIRGTDNSYYGEIETLT